MRSIALSVVDTRSRLYRTGMLRRAAKVRVLSTIISLPAALRNDLVHLSCSRKEKGAFFFSFEGNIREKGKREEPCEGFVSF